MPRVSLSNLETLVYIYDNPIPIALMAFIRVHHSIKKLHFYNKYPSLASLEREAPQLAELHMQIPLRYLCQPNQGSTKVAFPRLKHLYVTSNLIYEISVEEFDTFVRSRCLPVGHPKALAKEPSDLISSLCFVQPPFIVRPKWYESDLYKESTRSKHRHPQHECELIRLRWSNKA